MSTSPATGTAATTLSPTPRSTVRRGAGLAVCRIRAGVLAGRARGGPGRAARYRACVPDGPDEQTLELEVVNVRFVSDDGQFAVLDAVPAGDDAVPGGHEVVVGPVGHLEEGDRVVATGRRTSHPKHGERFQVRSLQSLELGDDEAVAKVLQRVPGVGPRAAELLLERFGDELLQRMEADPRDVLSNGLGGLLGATLVGLVRSLLPERRRRRRLHPRTA